MVKNSKIRTCRVCGCTDQSACFNEDMGFCWWVGPELCSHCDPETVAIQISMPSLKPVSIPTHSPDKKSGQAFPSREGNMKVIEILKIYLRS